MNLYRSFGNLMETWMMEGTTTSEWLDNIDEDSPLSSSDMDTNLRSESVDSGVETPSSDMSFPVTSCSVSAEMDTFTPEREDRLTQASPVTLLPPSSSSSPHLSPQQQGSTDLHLKLEQALQRTESKKDDRVAVTVEEMIRRQPRAPFLPKRHMSDVVRGQRSGSFSLRSTVSPSALVKQMSETRRRPQSMTFDKRPTLAIAEDFSGEQNLELSPGLRYLEQVCQMLEEIARKQMHNRVLQMEMEALEEVQESQVNQIDAGDKPVPCYSQKLENTNVEQNASESQQCKAYPNRHICHRSASDTNLTTLHSRRLRADSRGQHHSTEDLQETAEQRQDTQEFKKKWTFKGTNSLTKNWRLKIAPSRREEFAKSLQTQSSERSFTRRRLSQLFRRRKNSQPS